MVLRHADGMLLQDLYVLRKQNILKNEQLKNSDFNLRNIKRKVEVEELKLKGMDCESFSVYRFLLLCSEYMLDIVSIFHSKVHCALFQTTSA